MESVNGNELTWDITWEIKNANLAEGMPKKHKSDNLELEMLDSIEHNEDEPEEESLDDAKQENNELALQLHWWRKSREQPEQVVPTVAKVIPSIIKPHELKLKPLPKHFKYGYLEE